MPSLRHPRPPLEHGATEAPPGPPPTIGWDPVVVAPPAVALLAVLAMLLMVANPIHHAAPAPEPAEPSRDAGALIASATYASARPGAPGRPIPPSIPERTTLGHPAAGRTFRTEARSSLLVVPAPGPLGLRSVQAP